MTQTASSQPQDRRRFTRIHFDGTTSLLIAGQLCPVELEDLSLKGALIYSHKTLPILTGDRLTMQIDLTDHIAILHFEATLVRIMGHAYGVRFDTIDLDTLTHLRRLMELNLGDENLLERELEQLFPEGT